MESRTRLTLGGMATVTASIAVVCTVAMTTSAALADSPGAPTGTAVRLPVSIDVRSVTTTTVAPASPSSPEAPVAEPETVPGPDPEEIADHAQTSSGIGSDVPEPAASGPSPDATVSAAPEARAAEDVPTWLIALQAGAPPLDPAGAGTSSGRSHSGATSGSERERSQVPPG